ncbi:Hypothetical protein BAMTRB_041 [Escherichia phage vB_Eco_Bam]|uniref:Uncharacterized protein n=1 Tax=Escherichia phage vB_Eco_Bam TaxID=2898833 RepID=A0A9P0VLE8_9CAUD|nr:Hypothetical protein MAK_040 [Escherichia phage vB_Eco_Mak]CAH7774614.1 hypothetical protein VN4_42 [Vibrio phage N4] [Escherichia phage vB_Eco_Titus]CAI9888964.1 Hypothetical protein BAMTRB_041 [Escherichia phage vB_Eco_Bam]
MPSPKAQDTVEFGWSGTDGYIRNGGKYNLLTSKPKMTFAYDTVMYSTDPAVEDVRTVGLQVFPLQPNEMSELNAYAVAHSINDPWNPADPADPVGKPEHPVTNMIYSFDTASGRLVPVNVYAQDGDFWVGDQASTNEKRLAVLRQVGSGFTAALVHITDAGHVQVTRTDNAGNMVSLDIGDTDIGITTSAGRKRFVTEDELPPPPPPPAAPVVQSIDLVDTVKLAGANYVSNTAVLTQTLMQENGTGDYVVKHRLVSYGTFNFPATSSNTKSTTLSLSGMFSGNQYVFCDEMTISGWTVSGGSNPTQHSYRIDQTKRQTNQIVVQANGTTNGALTVAATIVIEFNLPNQDYGLGVPFPEFA